MNALASTPVIQIPESAIGFGKIIEGTYPEVLSDIYQKDTNIVIWQRDIPSSLRQAAADILLMHPDLQLSIIAAPEEFCAAINKELGPTQAVEILSQDIAVLVEMFCCLFDLKRAGLRLTVLDRAICPRFHVDKVPCRLVTTYQGVATEWLPHVAADRSKLGAGNLGKSDEQSGLFKNTTDIRRLGQGDVALLKGERWVGNEGAGLIHRSPSLSNETRRLLLTLDFIDD